MFCKQAFHPGAGHYRRYSHQHHPFGQFMKQMKEYSDTPPANVEELDDHYQLLIYAPGFDKQDFEIRVKDDTLLVSGKVREPKEDVHHWRRKEFGPKSFERYFQLNEKIDKETITAKYEDGVLRIHLAKKAGFETRTQNIDVQ